MGKHTKQLRMDEGREERKRFLSFASSPRQRLEIERDGKPRLTELPLISVSLTSAGTSSQAKTKRRRTMLMFCLLAKDDFNTNTKRVP